jgi:hypothetical protein
MTKYEPASNQKATQVRGLKALLLQIPDSDQSSHYHPHFCYETDLKMTSPFQSSMYVTDLFHCNFTNCTKNSSPRFRSDCQITKVAQRSLLAYLPKYHLVLRGGALAALSCSSRDRQQSCWTSRQTPALWCRCWTYRPQSCHWWCH